jgi:hypothetical protein
VAFFAFDCKNTINIDIKHMICSDKKYKMFTNKTDCHDISEILLKGVLNTINQPIKSKEMFCDIGNMQHQ